MRYGEADPAAARSLARLRKHRFGALIEPLADEPSFLVKAMFGGLAVYLHGRMMLVLMDRRPPWRGLCVLTTRECQPTLRAEMPALAAHPVLAKWLYLADGDDDFEEVAGRLVDLIRGDDPRIGVESKPRRPSRTRRKPTKVRRPARRARG
jgi:hypothetical protein